MQTPKNYTSKYVKYYHPRYIVLLQNQLTNLPGYMIKQRRCTRWRCCFPKAGCHIWTIICAHSNTQIPAATPAFLPT